MIKMEKIVGAVLCVTALLGAAPAMAEDLPMPDETGPAPAVATKLQEEVKEEVKAEIEEVKAPALPEEPAASAVPVSAPVQEKIAPRKVEVDSNYDGKVDRTEIYDANGQISRVEADSNGDGKVDEWMAYENGRPVQSQRDSNGDGKIDVWVEY